jgi:putative Holliday junction resolvase
MDSSSAPSPSTRGKILGVDFGTVRVGLALSDDWGMFAAPLETVPRVHAVKRIQEIIQQHDIRILVLGMPRNMNGTYGPRAEEVRAFALQIQKQIAAEIKFVDERLTTQAVEKLMIHADVSRKRRKEVVDQLAAQQILQTYLDMQQEPNA